jgi:hypothetical protein
MATLCVLALLATGKGLISIVEWTMERQLIGIWSYPEKHLIAICLSSATSLLAARAIGSEHISFRILRSLSFWTSVVIGSGALLTKTAISMISADRDIHQWHLICVWAGGLLLALAGSGCPSGSRPRSDPTAESISSENSR